ncbi:hypothetical protein SELMODRAFT_413586 [Selaginella moellendorffii]|uniref:Uncharacterized protein n=1 Tax=Selaginella moellendorffii TaxID=88036 RepID=D8RQR5_SELML|nr:hypothetical protein SELMODRAFT_413586 [Selaginella moellendorffii]
MSGRLFLKVSANTIFDDDLWDTLGVQGMVAKDAAECDIIDFGGTLEIVLLKAEPSDAHSQIGSSDTIHQAVPSSNQVVQSSIQAVVTANVDLVAPKVQSVRCGDKEFTSNICPTANDLIIWATHASICMFLEHYLVSLSRLSSELQKLQKDPAFSADVMGTLTKLQSLNLLDANLANFVEIDDYLALYSHHSLQKDLAKDISLANELTIIYPDGAYNLLSKYFCATVAVVKATATRKNINFTCMDIQGNNLLN